MSLGGGSEVHRAVSEGTLPTGGLTEDQSSFRIQATEDRTIVAVSIAMRGSGSDGGIEVSFSADAEAVGTQNGSNDAKAGTLAVNRGGQTMHFDGLDEDWAAGEELHAHTENNTGGGIRGAVVVYYREG